jgi:hypothetical protein
MSRILVGNLPPDVSADGLQQVFADLGLNVGVKLNREGDPDKIAAIVEAEDLDRIGADSIVAMIDGHRYKKDHTLTILVPLFA